YEYLAGKAVVGTAPGMIRVREIIAKVADSDSPVLIEGESGTGKELVAAAIHRQSGRSKGPFVPVNCSAIPADLMESEFFGHVRGAFSGAVADALGLFRSAPTRSPSSRRRSRPSCCVSCRRRRSVRSGRPRPIASTSG